MSGYLNTLFPQVDVNQLGPVAGMMLGDQFNMAKQNNSMNQNMLQQSLEFDRQLQPSKVSQGEAQAELTRQQGRQQGALADKNIWDLEQDKRLAEPKYQDALSKFTAGIQENEVKKAHAILEQQLLSPDPKVRAQAKQMYMATGDMLKMYEKARLEKEKAIAVANIGANSRAAAAAAKGGAGDFWTNALKQTKADPTKLRSALIAEATRVQASDPEQAQLYLQQAKALEEQQNAALAGAQPAYIVGPDGKPMLNPNAQRPLASTPNTQQPQQESKYQAGQVYSGKTGKYRYKGGDPNNKANWEKVE